MLSNLSINNSNNTVKQHSPSTEQQVNKDMKSYLDGEKLNISKEDLSANTKQLLSKQLTVKQFVKNAFNSNSSKNIENIESILQSHEVEVLKEEAPRLPAQMNKMLNQQAKTSESFTTNMNNAPKIETTSPEAQLLASNLVGLLKEGKMKEALNSFNKKGDVLEKMIDSYLSQSSQSTKATANLLSFIQNVVAMGLVVSPELQQALAEKYKKLEKHLSFSEELALENEADIDGLADDAQDFVKNIMDLRQQLEFLDQETAEDVLESYEELLGLIGAA